MKKTAWKKFKIYRNGERNEIVGEITLCYNQTLDILDKWEFHAWCRFTKYVFGFEQEEHIMVTVDSTGDVNQENWDGSNYVGNIELSNDDLKKLRTISRKVKL
jgi:hypothetical protein